MKTKDNKLFINININKLFTTILSKFFNEEINFYLE